MGAVTFDEATHTYRIDGIVVPSVTQCLEPCHDFRFVKSEDLERAQKMGRKIHRTVELFELGRLNVDTLHPVLKAHLDQWIKAKEFLGYKVISTERTVHSVRHQVAGTMDLLVEDGDGKRGIIDIKSGNYYAAHELQTAGYKLLAKEEGIVDNDCFRGCLYLSEDEFNAKFHTGINDEVVFVSLLNYTRWKRSKK